jgi:hypothetical protein
MRTFILTLQKPCGPRANPVNHRQTVVVVAETEGHACWLAHNASGLPVVRFVELAANIPRVVQG